MTVTGLNAHNIHVYYMFAHNIYYILERKLIEDIWHVCRIFLVFFIMM